MVEVSNNFQTECEAYVGSYKFGKIKVNYIDDNPLNYEQGAYSSTNGTKIDATQSVRYNKLVECEPNFKYKIELGNSAIKMKIITYTEAQAFIAAHDNLVDGNELTTEATAKYISVTIYSNDTLEGTAIVLNNTIKNGEIAGVELQGNTTQNGTPTPSSPVPVNNVTGEQVVRVCGKNLLENNGTSQTIRGVTFTKNDDGSILVNGTATGNVWYVFNSSITLEAGTYTISSGNTNNNIRLVCDALGGFVIRGLVTKTINETKTSNVSINVPSGSTANNLVFKPMIEKGTTATTYEPYQGKDYEINLGKNLLQYSNFSNRTENGITITNNNDGTFTVNGTATANVSLAIDPNNFIPMKGTWRITGCPSGGSSSTYMLSTYVGYWGEGSPNIDTGSGTNITYTGNVKVRFFIKSGTTCNNLLFKPMVTYDLNATYEDFAPYFEPIELCKIGEYQDYIYNNNGTWYKHSEIYKLVLDGTEKWVYDSDRNYFRCPTYDFSSNIPLNMTYENKNTYNQFCNLFTINKSWSGPGSFRDSTTTQGIFYPAQAGGYRLLFRNTDYTNTNDFKSWLNSNNILLYYILATPTDTLIENEELIEQLDRISHAETQEGITNIMTTGNLPVILDVMPDLTESIRGKQIKPYIGYNITSHDDLKNFKITGKADSNGKILGATPQTQIDIEIFNENNKHNLENKQIYVSTGLDETEGNYVEWQPFTITQAKDTQTKNHTNYTGYDDMMRNTTQYIDNIDYGEEGIPLYDYLCKVAKQIGMAVANDTIVNGDFIVRGNNFTNNEKISTVLSDIGKIADGFMMINRDNLLEVVDIAPIDDTREAIELTTNLYNEDFQNSPAFGPTNELAIGETNIETNAIVKSDEEAIAKDGVKKIEILDNYFLGELANKEAVANVLWEHLNGFSYYPYKTPYNGYPYIDLGDKLNITDINNNTYNSFIFNYVFEYNGGYNGNIGAEALSITAAKYKTTNTLSKQFRKVGIDIDRVEGKITSEIDDATDGITKAYNTAINQTAEKIELSVTEINNTISGNPKVEGDIGLAGLVKTINENYLTVDSEGFTAVSKKAEEAQKKADAVDDNTKKIVSQLHFDAETGLTISAEGSTDDDMKLNLTNSQVNFMYRNSPVLVINGNKIEFAGATFQKFDLGNYVWQAEDDDSLSLIYEGD